jgi:hypothetical protein
LILTLTQGKADAQNAAGGQAPDPEEVLQQAERYFEALEYEAALKTFFMIHQIQTATPLQRARAFLYMGICFTALGDSEKAVLSFMELLKIKADFRLPPGVSPSIVAMFKEALNRLKLPENPPTPEGGQQGGQPSGDASKTPVSLEAEAPKELTAGKSVEIKIQIKDPKKLIQDLLIQWRRVGGPDYSTIRVKHSAGEKQATGTIPGALVDTEEGRLHYIVEAKGKGGKSLATAGTLSVPLEVKLLAPPQPKSRWGWYALAAGGGLAVIGGVVAAILLTRDGDGDNSEDSTNLTITIR